MFLRSIFVSLLLSFYCVQAVTEELYQLLNAVKNQTSILHESLKNLRSKSSLQKIRENVYKLGPVTIEIVKEDIVSGGVDAIVNAANKALPKSPGGVAGAIWDAAGSTELNEWVSKNVKKKASGNKIELGEALASPSFKLKKVGINIIIHTAGPDCRISEPIKALYENYKNSLKVADAQKAKSIRIPPISTGIFGCDKNQAANYAVKAIMDTLPQLKNINLIKLTIYDAAYRNEIIDQLDQYSQK